MLDRVIFDSPRLYINLSKKVNIYWDISASGKSYMPSVAEKYADSPNILKYCTQNHYNDLIETGFVKRDNCIYFLDRYDLFRSDNIDKLICDSRDTCVLIDLKGITKLKEHFDYEIATITRDNGRIELYNAYVFRG